MEDGGELRGADDLDASPVLVFGVAPAPHAGALPSRSLPRGCAGLGRGSTAPGDCADERTD